MCKSLSGHTITIPKNESRRYRLSIRFFPQKILDSKSGLKPQKRLSNAPKKKNQNQKRDRKAMSLPSLIKSLLLLIELLMREILKLLNRKHQNSPKWEIPPRINGQTLKIVQPKSSLFPKYRPSHLIYNLTLISSMKPLINVSNRNHWWAQLIV